MKASEKNRIQNCMTVSNIGIASVLSDPFGKTATEIMSYLLEHTSDSMDEKAVRKLIRKSAKAKSDDIIEAIKGYHIEPDQAKKLELARGHLDYLEGMITQTEVELYVRIRPSYEFVEYVSTMPGMTELSSTIVLSETGVDMSVFEDEKHLCSWCGLAPANNESAKAQYGSFYREPVSKTGSIYSLINSILSFAFGVKRAAMETTKFFSLFTYIVFPPSPMAAKVFAFSSQSHHKYP